MEFDTYVTSKLTENEMKIVKWLVLGLTNRQIAVRIFFSPQAVKYHLINMYKKFGATNRTNLVYILAQHVIKDERFLGE